MGPERTCVGCRTKRVAPELVRVVAGPLGGLAVSVTSRGRGAWLCRDSLRCFDRAVASRAFQRALRRELELDALVALRRLLVAGAEGGEGVGG